MSENADKEGMSKAVRWIRVHAILIVLITGLCAPTLDSFAFDWKCGRFFASLGRGTARVKQEIDEIAGRVFGPPGRLYRYYTGRATQELDARSFALFDRVRLDPDSIFPSEDKAIRAIYERYLNEKLDATRALKYALLSADEKKLLKEAGLESHFDKFLDDVEHLVKQDAVDLFRQYRAGARAVRELNHQLALLHRAQPDHIERPVGQRWWNRVRSIFLPFIPDQHGNKVRAVYQRFLDNPELKLAGLSQAEREIVKNAGLENDLQRFLDHI